MAVKIAGFLCVFLLASCPFAVGQSHNSSSSHHWSYSGEGGPEHWVSLDSKFAACKTGQAQSPIDIKTATTAELPALQFDYHPSPLNIVDNGHTIMVTYAPGSTLKVGDKVYELKQFHFHHPSEEQIDGKPSDMVAHLVHQDSKGHLAVVAVLLKTGSPNSVLDVLWSHLPKEKDQTISVPDVINVANLLPASRGYYTYSGSLTTPPCTEGVRWFVLKQTVEVSPQQVQAFAKLYPDNARPVQPLHGRTVQETGN